MDVLQAVQFLEEQTITYAEAAELLGVHEAYVRRIVADVETVELHGRKLLKRDAVVELKNVREQGIQTKVESAEAKAAAKLEAAKAREAARHEREAAKAQAEEAKAQRKAQKAAAIASVSNGAAGVEDEDYEEEEVVA